MDTDLTPYTAVTPELEDAEREAILAALGDATEEDQTIALAWVQQFQRTRGIMQLAMAGIIRPGVEDGSMAFQLVIEFDDDAMERIEGAGLFADVEGEDDDQDPSLN